MIINPSPSTGSQCKNSISLVLLIFVLKLSTSDENRGLRPASIDDDDDDKIMANRITRHLHRFHLSCSSQRW